MNVTRTLERANTIPEMALIISLVMLTLFGVIQYAIVGFNQIGADGAAFVGDHATVVQYSNPTTGNAAYGQSVALGDFPHAQATYVASIPKTGTYEVRLSSARSGANGMAQLFPSTVSTRSRIVEPAQTVVNAQTPAGQCGTGPESITYNGTSLLNRRLTLLSNKLSGPAVSSLYKPITDAKGNTALAFDNGTLSAQLAALDSLSTDLSATANGLQKISTALAPLGALGTPVAQAVSSQLSPLLASASGGAYTAAGGGTISITTPLTSTQFSTQVSASTTAISTLQKQNILNSTLTGVFTTVINPVLYSGSTVTDSLTGKSVSVPGLLTGGPNGGVLGDMNAAQNVLFGLDSNLPSC